MQAVEAKKKIEKRKRKITIPMTHKKKTHYAPPKTISHRDRPIEGRHVEEKSSLWTLGYRYSPKLLGNLGKSQSNTTPNSKIFRPTTNYIAFIWTAWHFDCK